MLSPATIQSNFLGVSLLERRACLLSREGSEGTRLDKASFFTDSEHARLLGSVSCSPLASAVAFDEISDLTKLFLSDRRIANTDMCVGDASMVK